MLVNANYGWFYYCYNITLYAVIAQNTVTVTKNMHHRVLISLAKA